MKKKKNYKATILVLLILIAFPLISIFYLNRGLDFRKDILSELSAKAALPNLQYRTLFDKSIKDLHTEKEHFSLLVDYKRDITTAESEMLRNLCREFAGKGDLSYLFASEGESGLDAIRDLAEELDLNTSRLGYYSGVEVPWPDSLASENRIALVDTAMQILNFYRGEDKVDMNRLARHLSVTRTE